MVRNDHFSLALSGLGLPSTIHLDCRWWVGQAGRQGAFSPMPFLYRVRTGIAGGPGGSQVSTMYFDATSPFTAQAAVDTVYNFWNNLKAGIANDLTFTIEPAVYTIDATTGEPTGIVSTGSAAVSGTNANDTEPWATQGLVEWRTGNFISGREIRGRTFIPGPTYDQSSGGVPSSTYNTRISSAVTSLLGDTDSALMVYSRKNFLAAQVDVGSPWTKWAVLRSRRD